MTDLRVPPHVPSLALNPANQSTSAVSSDQQALMDEMQTTAPAKEPSFSIALDESADLFVATKNGVEFGGVLFAEKNDRVLLLATSILPEFRGQGLAAALTRRVLDMFDSAIDVASTPWASAMRPLRVETGPSTRSSTEM